MNDPFTHLHVHSEFSLLDGFGRLRDLVAEAKDLGMDALALTDHGVMFGVVDFYKICKEAGIKPIIGCEVYVAARRLDQKEGPADREPYHLILLAENNTGYKNLMKIVSKGYVDGFYYKPRIDHDYLRTHAAGLICMSACISGEIPAHILNNDVAKAEETIAIYQEIFGKDNFFLEIMDHKIPQEARSNQVIIQLAEKYNIPLVATNDVHYVKKSDSEAHDVLLCIQTGTTVEEENRMRYQAEEFYLKSSAEMWARFSHVPQALTNTKLIAERCNVTFDLDSIHLPAFEIPAEEDSSESYLRHLCLAGAKQKYGEITPAIEERLDYELATIHEMGFDNYFLVVWDFIRFAKDHDIMVGPGRGSAAGSIVSYALDITTLDPLKYNLLFERFLNPERVSLPDIDCDFCYERRQEVIDYVVAKYGLDHVAQIITFGTMAARGAVRDVGRVLNMPYSEVDRVAKEIPLHAGQNVTIAQAKEENSDLARMGEREPRIAKLLTMAESVEGLSRHASTHAAGVVIADAPLTEYVPLYRNGEVITTQFPMGLLEDLGLIKMDFLGLRTLTVIRDAVTNIAGSTGEHIDIDNLDFNDPAVYAMISRGDCLGVFQLESSGMMSFMKELQPQNFEDIIAGISLYRPGPMEQIPRYIANKKDPEHIRYTHPILESILDVTYGCMVYQEQVMQIFRDVAGFSMGRSDLVRRAMSKKKLDVMDAEGQVFIHGETAEEGKVLVDGAVRRGVDVASAEKIYAEMKDFAKYAFNKSHAAAYAVIAYQTAWLKHYYPKEFMAALMSSVMDNEKKVAKYIENCKRMNIAVKAPDVNVSGEKFSVVAGNIHFGLGAVKGLGKNAIAAIVAAREKGGAFESFRDFCERVDLKTLNKRMMEGLIKSGAFDFTEISRASLLSGYATAMDRVLQEKKDRLAGQLSLVDFGQTADLKRDHFPEAVDFTKEQRLVMEKEVLGIYVSGHPLEKYQETLDHYTNLNASMLDSAADLEEAGIKDGDQVVVGGLIDELKSQMTKNGKLMAFMTIEDIYGRLEVVVFPNSLERYRPLLKTDRIVLVTGKINYNEDMNVSIICDRVKALDEVSAEEDVMREETPPYEVNERPQNNDYPRPKDKKNKGMNNCLLLKLEDLSQKYVLGEIKPILKKHPGKTPVVLYFKREQAKYGTSEALNVSCSETLVTHLQTILGKKNVEVRE